MTGAAGTPPERRRADARPSGADAPGIYLSIPFCAQKCTYCNFRSGVYARSLRAAYVHCVAAEIRAEPGPAGDTLYWGGGSPSLLEPEEFSFVAAALPRRAWAEATIEVAPGETDAERVRAWARSGVNRASLGVQSFVPEVARAAGRRHGPGEVRAALRALAATGIRNVSIDLIAGLAGQTPATWRRSLDWIERLEVDHVSVYMLEADDDSRLGRELQAGGDRYGAHRAPDEDLIVELYLAAVERLRALGYERYEVSNFARPGKRSRHNARYWALEPYLGFGSDAHSFDGRRRWANVATAPAYVERMEAGRSPREACEELDAERLLEDRALCGLRRREGVRLEPWEWGRLAPRAAPLKDRGWLEIEEPALRLTDRGLLFADQAIAELLG